MKYLKAHKLSFLALAFLIGFVALSYYQDSVYLNKILVSSFILSEVILMNIFGSFQRLENSRDQNPEKVHFE